jgi:cytochrome c oxidase subunit 4
MAATEPTNLKVSLAFGCLLVLLAATAIASRWLSGQFGAVAGLLFAALKMTLIFLIFMRLKYQSGLIRVFAVAGFFWLGLMAVFFSADYLTRV